MFVYINIMKVPMIIKKFLKFALNIKKNILVWAKKDFFRRVISQCHETDKIPSLTQLLKEAVDIFYDEFDYYPDIGVYAPGVYTIMGDHLEYVEGNLVQAALPLGTIIVGKSLNSVKCKVITTSKDVEGLKKAVFPISYFKNKNIEVFPPWVTFIQGIICNFPCKDLKGFDALIHSSIPSNKGLGRSAALQVAFYSFLEATCGYKTCKNKEDRGKICRKAESNLQSCECKVGLWDNLTSSLVDGSTGLFINCCKSEIFKFDVKEIDILFLLTYPNFEIEVNDRTLIARRNMELQLAAKLLGLSHINQATEKHLKILEMTEDPTRETVIEILCGLGIDEECILEFVEELFYFPKLESDVEEIFLGEEASYVFVNPEDSFTSEANCSERGAEDLQEEQEKVYGTPCFQPTKPAKWTRAEASAPRVNYLQQRIAELCSGKTGPETKTQSRICEEINCLGGIENLSVASDLTVNAKLLRRVRHVVTEKTRCMLLPDIIYKRDYVEFGTRIIHSHLSLKIDFEVSCPTLDSLVQLAIDTKNVYGSKMMSGGGTLTLVHRRAVEELIKKIKEKFGSCFNFYLVFPSPGADILNIGIKNNPKSKLSNSYLNKTDLMKEAVKNFEETYKYRPTHGAFSPNMINIIGDHMDYNHGFNLSMAISLLTVVVGALNGTSKVRVATTSAVDNEPQKVIFPVPVFEDITPGRVKWAKLIKGVISHFEGSISGFDCLIESNLPHALGISNQTTLVVAFYTFLEELMDRKTYDICQKAVRCMHTEQNFANTSCGAGAHTVSIRAKEDYAMLLDCRSLSSTLIPFEDTSVCVLLTFTETRVTDIRRTLFCRMEECYKVARALGGKTLRCLTLKSLQASRNLHILDLDTSKISETALKRAKHIILENERVLRSSEALKNNDFELLGELMVASHSSLRHNFDVTTPELDFLVERAMEVDGVLGAKMQCSGNASSTVTLVKRWAVDDLIDYLKGYYTDKLDCFVVSPYGGCGSLNVKEYVDSIPGPQFVFEDIFPF